MKAQDFIIYVKRSAVTHTVRVNAYTAQEAIKAAHALIDTLEYLSAKKNAD